jgi:hypothetical protein
LPLTAVVARAPFVRARVYFVDGKVALPETSLFTSSHQPGAPLTGSGVLDETAPFAEPTSWFEAPS